VAAGYPAFKKSLQGLKGLSDEEAEAFFRLCGKKRFSVKDVENILVSIKAHKKSRATAYNVVERFQNAELITSVSNSHKKQEFECVHPRAIFNQLKEELKNAEKDLRDLEQAYETSDFDIEDPREKCRQLKGESEIASACYTLRSHCQITVLHDGSKVMVSLLDRISDSNQRLKTDINVVLFKNKDKDKSGVILISKRSEKGGNIRLYGHILYDSEKLKYFQTKEVKKNG